MSSIATDKLNLRALHELHPEDKELVRIKIDFVNAAKTIRESDLTNKEEILSLLGDIIIGTKRENLLIMTKALDELKPEKKENAKLQILIRNLCKAMNSYLKTS